ncbi:MAG: response regulator [Planctomycetes bacterium]|nr:response regulator [Planctomycetota bacterium]
MNDSARILCIDDNGRNLRILQELLEDDFQLSCATSGEDGLSSIADFHPELILLDVMMPGLDGYEVCRRVKADPSTADIPVVLLSALARDDDRERGSRAGADAYLAKPFDPDALLDLVENYIGATRAVRNV